MFATKKVTTIKDVSPYFKMKSFFFFLQYLLMSKIGFMWLRFSDFKYYFLVKMTNIL